MKLCRLKEDYRKYGFMKNELEQCLGFPIDDKDLSLPDYLSLYEARTEIRLEEAIRILAGCKPNEEIEKGTHLYDLMTGYETLLLEAIEHSVLSTKKTTEEYGEVILSKDDIGGKWAKKNNFDWPFSLPTIKSLYSTYFKMHPPTQQKTRIVSPFFSVLPCILKFIEYILIIMRIYYWKLEIGNLKSENNSLKDKIKELKTKQPSLLGVYREDDPLLIAIKLRNEEWVNYSEDNRISTPSKDGLVEQLKVEYKEIGMTDTQAKSIEKVACPIKRR